MARSYREELGRVVHGAAVPFGYTLAVFAASGQLMVDERPDLARVTLFVLGALVGTRAAQSLSQGSGDGLMQTVALRVHAPAILASVGGAWCGQLPGVWWVAWPLTPLLSSAAYFLALALMVTVQPARRP